MRNVVVCTRHCRPYPPWLHGLHTRATVAAVPRSRLSSCALYSYVCVCVCVQVRSCAGCTPTCPRRRARVRVCSERERERGDRGELEGRRETDRERRQVNERKREREIMARRVDGKIIRAVDGRKLEGQREGSRGGE